jgi:hypothetical protein
MGNNTPNNNRIDQITSEQSLIAGFTKHASAITSMAILGTTQTTKDVVATLQSLIDSARAVQTTRATWQVAVQADRALRDKTKTFVSVVKQSLLAAFAGQLDTLADFGLTARKPHVATPEEKIAAAAKAKATREARHTNGIEAEGCCRTLGSRADGVARGGVRPSSSPDVGRSDNGSRGRDRFPIGRGHVTPRLRPACFSRAGMPTKLARIQCVGWNRSK